MEENLTIGVWETYSRNETIQTYTRILGMYMYIYIYTNHGDLSKMIKAHIPSVYNVNLSLCTPKSST